MRYHVTLAGRTVEVDLSGSTPFVDGTPFEVDLGALPRSPVRHLLANRRGTALLSQPGPRRGDWTVTLDHESFQVQVVDERTRAIREMTGAEEDAAASTITAPMPGLVVRIEVEEGQTVRAGQGMVIVEAMKMENELKAPADGVVTRVMVTAGQTVEKGAVLVVLE